MGEGGLKCARVTTHKPTLASGREEACKRGGDGNGLLVRGARARVASSSCCFRSFVRGPAGVREVRARMPSRARAA
jgi:hypothetical protein